MKKYIQKKEVLAIQFTRENAPELKQIFGEHHEIMIPKSINGTAILYIYRGKANITTAFEGDWIVWEYTYDTDFLNDNLEIISDATFRYEYEEDK